MICSASSMSEGVECSTPSVRGVVVCLEIEMKRTKFRGKRVNNQGAEISTKRRRKKRENKTKKGHA